MSQATIKSSVKLADVSEQFYYIINTDSTEFKARQI